MAMSFLSDPGDLNYGAELHKIVICHEFYTTLTLFLSEQSTATTGIKYTEFSYK